MSATKNAAVLPGAEHGVLFKNGTVLTMDKQKNILRRGDVLVQNDKIVAIGTDLVAPEGVMVIDAEGGIVMPGMVDTHRHMWQTAMRGYGADWTLTQYFVWYYLNYGKLFRPEDIFAGNELSALDAIDAGVTTTVDWSHGLATTDHANAALDALESSPGRFVFAYGNIQAAPWEWAAGSDFQNLMRQRLNHSNDMLSFQMAFDVLGDPAFQERKAFEVANDLGLAVTTHAGVWGATNDDGIRLMHENGFMNPGNVYVHAATLGADSYHRIAASGGSVSVSTESEQSCGQGYPPTWTLRDYGIPVSLSIDTSVWFSSDLFTAMRSTVGADRSREHMNAHAKNETITHSHLRAEHAVDFATMGGANALGLGDKIGSIEVGKQADIILIKNDNSPVMFPLLNPYGHVVMQAQRGDVHTVLVNGQLVKHNHKISQSAVDTSKRNIASTVDYLSSEMGEPTWQAEMNPDIPETKVMDNPYTYTEFRSDATHKSH
jgi:cytosine/adenosine deaminase-related metal-dependent hydrolase